MNRNRTIDMLHVTQVRALLEPQMLRMPNVVGVGTSFRRVAGKVTEEMVMRVMVVEKLPRFRIPSGQLIPSAVRIHSPYLDGEVEVGIDVVETGLHYPTQDPHRQRHRPVPGGVSIGAYWPGIGGRDGTGGGWVWDVAYEGPVLLSNAHVMARHPSNNTFAGQNQVVEIHQPSPTDSGILSSADKIGSLLRFIPLVWETAPRTPANLVDAAVALPDNLSDVDYEILHLGPAVYYTDTPQLNMLVSKCGRTTGDTHGVIGSINASVRLDYGSGDMAFFTGQFTIDKRNANDPALAGDGDSGSLWVSDDLVEGTDFHPVVGLHYGSNATGTHADATPISTVFSQLNLVTLCEGSMLALLESSYTGKAQRAALELRQLRNRMRQTKNGQLIDKMLARYPDVLFETLVLNPETRRLAFRIIEPLLHGTRDVRELEFGKITAEMVTDIQELLRCVGRIRPDAADALKLVTGLAKRFEGRTIAEILGLPDPCQPHKQ